MKRLKTFLIYALIIAAFWFLSDFLIYMGINSTYKAIETRTMIESPKINVAESKATYVNGYVKGNIFNDTKNAIKGKYLKIDLYSPRNVKLGTKYVKIDNLETEKTQDFEMWYKYTDVKYCNVAIVDNSSDADEKAFLSEKVKFYIILGFLVSLYFM